MSLLHSDSEAIDNTYQTNIPSCHFNSFDDFFYFSWLVLFKVDCLQKLRSIYRVTSLLQTVSYEKLIAIFVRRRYIANCCNQRSQNKLSVINVQNGLGSSSTLHFLLRHIHFVRSQHPNSCPPTLFTPYNIFTFSYTTNL